MTDQPRKRPPRKRPPAASAPPPTDPDEVAEEQPAQVDDTQREEPVQAKKPAPPTVQAVGDWQLVTHGTWQISVAPDGLLMLPRHLHPREVDDFIAAATVAKDVGAEVITANTRKSQKDNRSLPRRRAIVTEGEPPPGSVRMTVSQQQGAATIGRPRRGRRPDNPMTSGRAV